MGRKLAQPSFVGYDLFWIDALCINQQDLEERNEQVSMMWRIYREADQVLVWLGVDRRREMDSVKRMIYRLLEMGDQIERDSRASGHSPQRLWEDDQARYLRDAGLPVLTDDIWWPFCMFWRRTWFKRLWVLQEVAIAKSIVMLCGETTFEIIDLESVGSSLRLGLDVQLGSTFMKHGDRLEFRAVGRAISSIGNILRWCQAGEVPYHEWIRLALNGTIATRGVAATWNLMFDLCVSAKSSLKIDRIYAIIGMVGHLTNSHRRKQTVSVNYAESELEVKTRIITYILSELQWLNIIARVQHIGGVIRRPSWIPDLAADGHTFILHSDFNASMSLADNRVADGLPPFMVDEHLHTLRIPGYKLDTVIEISGTLVDLVEQPLEVLARMVASLGGTYVHTRETGIGACWRSLIAHVSDSKEQDEAMHISFLRYLFRPYYGEAVIKGREVATQDSCEKSVEQYLTRWLRETFPEVEKLSCIEEEPYLSYENIVKHAMTTIFQQADNKTDTATIEEDDLYRADDPFRRVFGKFVARHQFIRTKNGFVGLAPDLAQVGDEVWLIPRTTVPFILRRVDEDEDLHTSGKVPIRGGAHLLLVGESYIHGVMRGELFRDDCAVQIELPELEYVDLV